MSGNRYYGGIIMSKNNMNFEENIKRLEEIVALLEKGETPLEESMALFEEGVNLTNQCLILLDSAEHKIKKLTQNNGEIVESDFVSEE